MNTLKFSPRAGSFSPRHRISPGVHLLACVCLKLISGAALLSGAEAGFPCPEDEIARYTIYQTKETVLVDGKLEEPVWRQTPASPRFCDILTGQATIHDTRAALLWNEEFLYVAFRIEEPFVQARFTTNNSPIYYDNDVECFIAGPDAYYEFEVNAFNTTYEVFFIWEESYRSGGFGDLPEFQLSRLKPFNGVGFTTHPRGRRLGNFQWHFPGKQTAVFVDGTINDSSDRDRGWTVELAFPWKGMKHLVGPKGGALPPRHGETWRMDFSRFNQYKEAPPANDSGGWVWTRHGVWDSHIPECFAYMTFSTNDVAAWSAGKEQADLFGPFQKAGAKPRK